MRRCAIATNRGARTTDDPDEPYADWPGEYVPVRLPWPPCADKP
jgi:hypothetical protein